MKILFCLLSYLLGSFPTGYIFFRLGEKKDIRSLGSQSTGATNVLRLKGWQYAVPVALIDVLKGAFPAYLAAHIYQDRNLALAAAFFAVLGHCYPVYIRFRGGKGMATAIGAYAVLAFPSLLLSLAVFVAVIALTRYVSLGSLLAAFSFPLFTLLLGPKGTAMFGGGFAIFVLILIRHLGNVRRLVKGEERKFGRRSER